MTERRRYVDTHVHFWDSAVIDYPWLAGRGGDRPSPSAG